MVIDNEFKRRHSFQASCLGSVTQIYQVYFFISIEGLSLQKVSNLREVVGSLFASAFISDSAVESRSCHMHDSLYQHHLQEPLSYVWPAASGVPRRTNQRRTASRGSSVQHECWSRQR